MAQHSFHHGRETGWGAGKSYWEETQPPGDFRPTRAAASQSPRPQDVTGRALEPEVLGLSVLLPRVALSTRYSSPTNAMFTGSHRVKDISAGNVLHPV